MEPQTTKRMGRIAFIMPRFAHDHVRISHKEALTLRTLGYEILLVCRNPPGNTYLGMKTIAARHPTRSRWKASLNGPALLAQALRLKADIYVLTNPFALILGLLLAILGKCVIYVTHEDFRTRVEIRPDLPRGLRKIVGNGIVIGEYLLSRLAAVTVATQPNVQARYPGAMLLENAPLTGGPIIAQANVAYAKLPAAKTPTLVYSGSITRERGLLRMLDLVLLLNERQPWKLKLIGCISPASDLAVAERHPGWRYVEHIGHVHHSVSLAHIRQADFGLALLEDVGGYSKTSMTKLYEYMQLETPFVVSDFERWRDSIQNIPAGLFVEPSDIATIARQIHALFEDSERYEAMKRTGREFIDRRFNWESAVQPFCDAIVPLLSPTESPSTA